METLMQISLDTNFIAGFGPTSPPHRSVPGVFLALQRWPSGEYSLKGFNEHEEGSKSGVVFDFGYKDPNQK